MIPTKGTVGALPPPPLLQSCEGVQHAAAAAIQLRRSMSLLGRSVRQVPPPQPCRSVAQAPPPPLPPCSVGVAQAQDGIGAAHVQLQPSLLAPQAGVYLYLHHRPRRMEEPATVSGAAPGRQRLATTVTALQLLIGRPACHAAGARWRVHKRLQDNNTITLHRWPLRDLDRGW